MDRIRRRQIPLSDHVQLHQSSDPLPQQRPYRIRSVPAMTSIITGPQLMPDVMHQASNLQLFVNRVVPPQQLSTLPIVVENVHRIPTPIRHVPHARTLTQQRHQLVHSCDRHATHPKHPE